MHLVAGKVVRKEGAPTEVTVRFWDDTKPAPQDMLEATIFLNTDETNILILKTMGLMKAQELVAHVAGVALGRGDELLNDLIYQYESLSKIPGVDFPLD